MIEALRQCLDQDLDFATLFRFQYIVSRTKCDAPGMTHRAIGRHHLYTGQSVHISNLLDRKGQPVGVVIGIAVDRTGLIEGNWTIPDIDADLPDFFDRFEDYIVDVAGRYTFVLSVEDEERIYCDPVGMNGLVYHRDGARVASSLLLCLDREVDEHPLYDHASMERKGGRYSLLHTRDAEVRRVNPNFYLDLANFHETRFWPRDEVFHHDPSDQSQVVDQIIATTRHIIGAIADRFTCAMPVSGGRDSRLLVAMAGDQAAKIEQIYTHITNFSTRKDAAVAALVTQELGLPHEIHSRRTFAKQQTPEGLAGMLREFRVSAGTKAILPNELQTGVFNALAEGAVVLRGHQTDLLRAVFLATTDKKRWKKFFWQVRKLGIITAKDFDAAQFARFLPDYEAWLKTLPRNALTKQIDFMFLELYYSSTLGVSFPALSRNFYMSPFNSRRLITLALGFDDDYRVSEGPVKDVLDRINPNLNAIPYSYLFADLKTLAEHSPTRPEP